MKPIVLYEDTSAVEIGHSAWVRAINHPNHAPMTFVKTSRVISIAENGFETLSTVYRRNEPDKPTTD